MVMANLGISIPALRAWAAAKNPGERVGQGGSGYDCPVANYLEQSGLRQPFVCSSYIDGEQIRRTQVMITPDCIKTVLHKVDGRYCQVNLTAAQFLQILDQVEEESLCPAS
jgi:hypothetical protein